MNKNSKNKEKKMNVEIGEDATRYGEFISSYFGWVSPKEQKEKVEELQEMTKKEEKE